MTDETPTDDGSDVLNFEPADDAAVTLMTHGVKILPFVRALTTGLGVAEARYHFAPDELRTTVVDPANVGMANVRLPADTFSAYDVPDDGLEVGMPLTVDKANLTKALNFARKGRGDASGDPVRIDVFESAATSRVRVQVLREDQGAKRSFEFYTIDPDSVRQEPDIPDVDLPFRADPSIDAFRDAVLSIGDANDHAWFSGDGRTFIMGTQSSRNPSLVGVDSEDVNAVETVEFPGHGWAIEDADGDIHDPEGSLFSTDYLKPFAKGLKAADATGITIKFGNEFPAWIEFESTDTGLTGEYVLAPRIQSDG